MSTHDDARSISTGRPDDGSDQNEKTGGTSDGSDSGLPNPETGVGMGAGEDSTFEPEEDPEAQPEDASDR